MKRIGFFLVWCLVFVSCHENVKSPGKSVIASDGYVSYENIIKGLGKNYVINMDQLNKEDLLLYYKKKYIDFKADSMEYFNAVRSFFQCDSSIINYLINRYRGDTKWCSWVYTHNPNSSVINDWESKFTNEMGASVLIYDYLMASDNGAEERISASPEAIRRIIDKVSLKSIENWRSKNIQLSLIELRKKFRMDFG